MKTAKLVCVMSPFDTNSTAVKFGHNKEYFMRQLDADRFEAKWGRVGGPYSTKIYPMHKWHPTVNQKLKKGYRDVTPTTTSKAIGFESISDFRVRQLVSNLFDWSNQSVRRNYYGNASDYTLEQVAEAQNILDWIAQNTDKPIDDLNRKLIEIYTLFPRIMGNVADYLIRDTDEAQSLLEKEQNHLDTLRSQVAVQSKASGQENFDLLASFGLEMSHYEGELPHNFPIPKNRLRTVFKVKNSNTATPYEALELDNEMLGVHGTKRHVLWPIIQDGLKVRFASHGSLFGLGIYFADDVRKSEQYSDSNTYLIYRLKRGRVYDTGYNRLIGMTAEKLAAKGFDSVLGINTSYKEHIVFRNEQCDLAYVVDLN